MIIIIIIILVIRGVIVKVNNKSIDYKIDRLQAVGCNKLQNTKLDKIQF